MHVKYLPVLIVIVIASCTSLTSSTGTSGASVVQDGVGWAVDSFSVVGLAPVDTVTIWRNDHPNTPDSNIRSTLKFTMHVPYPGTFNIHAEFRDLLTKPGDTLISAGDGKLVVTEFKHLTSDFNIRTYRPDTTILNDTPSVTYSTILFVGHFQK